MKNSFAVLAQQAEHFLGKEEVGSSNLLDSSTSEWTLIHSDFLLHKNLFANGTFVGIVPYGFKQISLQGGDASIAPFKFSHPKNSRVLKNFLHYMCHSLCYLPD